MTFAAALFDMDGTLVDREPLLTAAVLEVMSTTTLTIDEHQVATWVGRAWHDVHDELGVADHLGWDVQEWHGRILVAADGLLASGFPVRELEGGAQLISWFAAGGVPVAVVTGSTHGEVEPVLEALGVGGLVTLVVAAGDYERGKPDAEPFALAAERLGVEPDRCIAFEDSAVGVASARAAGIGVVVATSEVNEPPGHPAHQRLDEADVIVPSLAAARRWLEGIIR